MHIIESGLSRQFFGHLTKSIQTYGSWYIKCWANYGAGAGVTAAGVAAAGAGAQYIFLCKN